MLYRRLQRENFRLLFMIEIFEGHFAFYLVDIHLFNMVLKNDSVNFIINQFNS